MKAAAIEFAHVSKHYGDIAAVSDVSFAIGVGTLVTLLGPSGCGKTTMLRMIAGLELPTAGTIRIGGEDVTRVPASARDVSMVFQSYALFPHMTVLENVSYGLVVSGLPKLEVAPRAQAALATVGLSGFDARLPSELSGGQQQRVAVARALVLEPAVLLFDEPLSNLDARLRLEMRNELRRIQRQIGISSIYVTHDQAEALAVSDWIMVMKDGRIVERGRPLDIYRYPRHVFTAQFLGTTNLIAGTVDSIDEVAGRLKVVTALGPIIGSDPTRKIAAGHKVRVSIRPEDLYETAGGDASLRVNVFEGALTFAIFAGVAVEAEVRCGEMSLACLLDREADLTPGRPATLRARAHACLVLPEE